MGEHGWINGRGRSLALAGIVIIAVAGAIAWWHFSGRETTDNAQIDGHIAPIASRVSGPVLEVKVTDNQAVGSGTLLVQIDPRDYRVAVARAEADLADARAASQAATTGVPIAETTTSSQLATATGKARPVGAALVPTRPA